MNAFLRLSAWILALALVALPVVAVVQGWIGSERWPLRTLRVSGQLERVNAADVRSTVLPHAKRGFFAVRLEDAQTAVARLPWVEHAEVRKQWPDILVVHVTEHRPFARWGTDKLLSEQGRVFPINGAQVPKRLPMFDGPETRSSEIVALYNEARALFANDGIDVRAVRIDPRGSWSMTLSTGAEVLIGRDDAKLRLQRFARLLPQLLAQKRQQQQTLARADLRYTNGFALSWAANRGEQTDAAPAVSQNIAAGTRATESATKFELHSMNSGLTT